MVWKGYTCCNKISSKRNLSLSTMSKREVMVLKIVVGKEKATADTAWVDYAHPTLGRDLFLRILSGPSSPCPSANTALAACKASEQAQYCKKTREHSTKFNKSTVWGGTTLSSRWGKEIVSPVAEKIMNATGGAPVKTKAVKSPLVWTLCLPGCTHIEAHRSGNPWKGTLSSMISISLLDILLNPHWKYGEKESQIHSVL